MLHMGHPDLYSIVTKLQSQHSVASVSPPLEMNLLLIGKSGSSDVGLCGYHPKSYLGNSGQELSYEHVWKRITLTPLKTPDKGIPQNHKPTSSIEGTHVILMCARQACKKIIVIFLKQSKLHISLFSNQNKFLAHPSKWLLSQNEWYNNASSTIIPKREKRTHPTETHAIHRTLETMQKTCLDGASISHLMGWTLDAWGYIMVLQQSK